MLKLLNASLGKWLGGLFGKKHARIGIYGPPNAGKTTLANRIARDFTGETVGSASPVPHETRREEREVVWDEDEDDGDEDGDEDEDDLEEEADDAEAREDLEGETDSDADEDDGDDEDDEDEDDEDER